MNYADRHGHAQNQGGAWYASRHAAAPPGLYMYGSGVLRGSPHEGHLPWVFASITPVSARISLVGLIFFMVVLRALRASWAGQQWTHVRAGLHFDLTELEQDTPCLAYGTRPAEPHSKTHW